MKHLKQSKIWFLSYAFTFFICIVTSFVVTGLAKYILMGQIEETMSIAFENSINTFERKIESQQIKMFTVLESENVVTLSNKYLHPDRGTQLELARKIMDTMNIQYANNEFTDDNIICFKELDMAIGVRDSMGKDQAYKQWFSDMYESFDEWNKDIFDIKNTIKFRPFTDSNGRAKFAVIQKRLLSIGAVPTVVAVSIIDVERFFGEMYEDPLYKIFVLSDSKQICSSFEGNQYEEKAENGKTVRFDGEEYIQYGRETNLLYFIQLFNSGDYTRRLSAVSRIGVIINICVFILGIFLSAFFTRINYTPLRRVMARFKLDVADENEFVAIEKGIENILQDRKNISRKLNESDERLYETYNKMLLNASSAEDARLIAQNLSMSFKYKNFAVSSFRINDIGSVSRKSDTQKENIRIATFCIINVYRELLSENIVCDFCTQDNNCYCILNFSDASAIHNICQITEKVCEFLKENFEMKLVYFVSAIGSIGDIPDMKEQLGTLENFSELITAQGFCMEKYADYLKTIYEKYYLSELMRAVDEGDTAGAVAVINRFINTVMVNQYSEDKYKQIFIDTLLKTYQEISNYEDSHHYRKAEQIIKNDSDINNIKSAVIKLYKSPAVLKKPTDLAGDETICTIIDFIEENYADENLNVSYISDKMNMSISQLSRYFKNNTNEGLAEYILRYRCKKAAELLDTNTDLTIAEAGKHCGFASQISFIRAFKRVYDITPGKYNQKRRNTDD